MKVEFVKLSPTQNMTLLVTTPVARSEQAALAERLMAVDSVCAEQVGFVETAAMAGARARLQMMGGEFCGNAAMSMAALFARADGLPEGGEAVVPLEISGADELVRCRIERLNGAFRGTVSMPLPLGAREVSFAPTQRYPVVFFPGIAHVVMPENAMTAAEAEARIADWCTALKADACGILRVRSDGEYMQPLVYVAQTRSAVWERGCGSGTAALGALLALEADSQIALNVHQPGGVIRVCARAAEGKLRELRISGTVRIVAEGVAWTD